MIPHPYPAPAHTSFPPSAWHAYACFIHKYSLLPLLPFPDVCFSAEATTKVPRSVKRIYPPREDEKGPGCFRVFPRRRRLLFLPPPPPRLSSLCINFLRRDPKKGEAAVAEKTEAASALLSRPVPGMESDNLGKISEKIYVLRTYRSVASFRELLRLMSSLTRFSFPPPGFSEKRKGGSGKREKMKNRRRKKARKRGGGGFSPSVSWGALN